MNEPIGFKCGCGGDLMITDFHRPGIFRFEVWCLRCRECDPNGYSSREEAIQEGRRYFSAKPCRTQKENNR